MIALTQLAPHTKATIMQIDGEELQVQLMEMGFIPGDDMILEITAPLGDPISILVAGNNLSIRKSEAEKVWVQIVGNEA
jgi:ferrous iron transport protein A